jgi:transcriptional regulator with XRE-family HTH domain
MARTKSNLLASALKAKGWDDNKLADETGIHITLVRRYLHDEVNIGLKNGLRIAHALGVTVESLVARHAA